MKTLPEVLLQLQAEQAEALIQTGAAATYPISRETVNDLLEAGVEAISRLRTGMAFDVTSIQVVRLHHGPDRIVFNFNGPPNFPRSSTESPSLTLECARGYAEEYLKLFQLPDGIQVEVIDPFSKV